MKGIFFNGGGKGVNTNPKGEIYIIKVEPENDMNTSNRELAISRQESCPEMHHLLLLSAHKDSDTEIKDRGNKDVLKSSSQIQYSFYLRETCILLPTGVPCRKRM